MNFESFAEGPLLALSLIIFTLGIITRLSFFTVSVIRSSKDKPFRLGHILATWIRLFFPFHKGVFSKPLYAFLRYLFHFCLIVVPIWFTGHIILWQFSWLGWDWTGLPYLWADIMTLVFLALAAFFLIRRLMAPEIRVNSSPSDYLLIIITALPFLTGFLLTHNIFEGTGFLGNNMRLFHVLSSEVMLIIAPFLFCRTRIQEKTCTGCAACEVNCPTGTIETRDEGKLRAFNYSHYQCICCAACVDTCPEGAAELRHEISVKRFPQAVSKHEIRKVELKECQRCGAYFAPEPQMDKIVHLPNLKNVISNLSDNSLRFCPQCRKSNHGDILHRLVPKPKQIKK